MLYSDYLKDKSHNAIKLNEVEGVPCVLTHSKGKNLRNYEIYGNSVQDGTPSPDTPIEIQSVGDLTTKNLFNISNVITNYTIGNTGELTSNANYSASDYIEVKPNTTYTFTIYNTVQFTDNSNSTVRGCLYTSDKTMISICYEFARTEIGYNTTTFTTSENTQYFRFGMRNTDIEIQLEEGNTATEYEPYHKYDIPITVRGKNLLPNSDWMSGTHSNGFTEQTNVDYITEYTQNSISFNLSAWTGVSSPRFQKDSVKRIVFKINQNQINSDDGYINFYIIIQGYDDNNNKVGSQSIYSNAVADTGYVFDFSTISNYSFYKNSTQFSFCVLARKNALSNFMVYDIAYYADTDTAVYEPYIGETKHIYLNEPLRKVGDYADYIDFKNQKVVRKIYETKLSYMKLSIQNASTQNGLIRNGYFMLSPAMIKGEALSGFCNVLPVDKSVWDTTKVEAIRFGQNNGVAYVYTKNTFSSQKELLDYLGDAIITYILDTPTEESVSLPTLKTFKGTSIMSVDTSIQPSNIKTKYIKL